jgi:hypothetical protein
MEDTFLCRMTNLTAPNGIAALHQQYATRWALVFEPDLAVWSASQRSADGRRRRVICDRDPAILASKLAAAEAGQ